VSEDDGTHSLGCRAWASSYDATHDVLDVDGDGREELILRAVEGHGGKQYIMRIDDDNTIRLEPTNLSQMTEARMPPKTMDINGDGLLDFYYQNSDGGIQIDISRGN